MSNIISSKIRFTNKEIEGIFLGLQDDIEDVITRILYENIGDKFMYLESEKKVLIEERDRLYKLMYEHLDETDFKAVYEERVNED
jgi:hypothetical protein